MKKTLRYMSMICLFVCTLSLTGCFSSEQRKWGKEIQSNAQSAVKAYLPEKYGFKAKIKSVSSLASVDLIYGGRYTGDAIVTCEYQGKTFELRVDEDGVVRDHYQREDILQDIGPFIQSRFSYDSHLVPQRLAVNLYIANPMELSQENWAVGYWGKDQFYDGDMESFIGKLSEPGREPFAITLLFGVTTDNLEVAMTQLMKESRALQRLVKNKAYMTFAFYNADRFSDNDVERAIQDDNIISLDLLGEFSNNQTIIRVYNYSVFTPVWGYGYGTGQPDAELDYMDVCGYSVNGELLDRDESYGFSNTTANHVTQPEDVTVLTDYFGTGSIAKSNNDLYPDHRYTRVDVAKGFPQAVAANKEFVILDAYEAGRDSRNPVLIVPSLRIGNYLYFDCIKYHDYAIAVKGEFNIPESDPISDQVQVSSPELIPQTVALAYNGSAVIKDDGSLWSWGTNNYGRVGDGTSERRAVPVKIMEQVVSVSTGIDHTVSVQSDGSLWTWGKNDYGQLGNGTIETSENPIKIMEDVVTASAGMNYTVAVKKDGSLWGWGYNGDGQFGAVKKNEYTGKPKKLTDNVVSATATVDYAFFVKTDGSLWTCRSEGIMGGALKNTIPIKLMEDVVSAAGGNNFILAIKTDGSLWGLGSNLNGGLGIGGREGWYYEPVKVMDDVAYVSADSTNAMAVKKDGTLWAWGISSWEYMEIITGNSDAKESYSQRKPAKIMNDVAYAECGFYHSMAVKTDGSLWVWGSNSFGQLGAGSTPALEIPTKIMTGVKLPLTS